jgi:hypothetical protein
VQVPVFRSQTPLAQFTSAVHAVPLLHEPLWSQQNAPVPWSALQLSVQSYMSGVSPGMPQ